jgi:hypothetical protein
MAAANPGHTEIVKVLHKAGADVNVQNKVRPSNIWNFDHSADYEMVLASAQFTLTLEWTHRNHDCS